MQQRRARAAAAAAAIGLGIALASTTAPARAEPPPAWWGLSELSRYLVTWMPRDFACVVATRPAGDPAQRFRVLVTRQRAVRRARRLVADFRDLPEITTAGVTSPRLRGTTMARIQWLVTASFSASSERTGLPGAASIQGEDPFGRTACPRVQIGLLPAGVASPAAEAWAASVVAFWGPDRVAIARVASPPFDSSAPAASLG